MTINPKTVGIVVIVSGVGILAILGFSLLSFTGQSENVPISQEQSPNSESQEAFKTFKSTRLGITFKYPAKNSITKYTNVNYDRAEEYYFSNSQGLTMAYVQVWTSDPSSYLSFSDVQRYYDKVGKIQAVHLVNTKSHLEFKELYYFESKGWYIVIINPLTNSKSNPTFDSIVESFKQE